MIVDEFLDLLSCHFSRNHTAFALRLEGLLKLPSRLSDPGVVTPLLLFQEPQAFKDHLVLRREASALDLAPNSGGSVFAYPNIHAIFYARSRPSR